MLRSDNSLTGKNNENTVSNRETDSSWGTWNPQKRTLCVAEIALSEWKTEITCWFAPSGQVVARWGYGRRVVWSDSLGRVRTLLSKHRQHELHCSSSSIDHRLFKRPPESIIKSIYHSKMLYTSLGVHFHQSNWSISQQIHLYSNQGKAHQLIWLHRWIGASLMGSCICVKISNRLLSVTVRRQ